MWNLRWVYVSPCWIYFELISGPSRTYAAFISITCQDDLRRSIFFLGIFSLLWLNYEVLLVANGFQGPAVLNISTHVELCQLWMSLQSTHVNLSCRTLIRQGTRCVGCWYVKLIHNFTVKTKRMGTYMCTSDVHVRTSTYYLLLDFHAIHHSPEAESWYYMLCFFISYFT